MNNIRLGYTETTLLLYYFCDEMNKKNDNYFQPQKSSIAALYATSGFYDKEIITSNLNDNSLNDNLIKKIKNSKTYNNYFSKLLHFLRNNNNFHLQLMFFEEKNTTLLSYRQDFLQYINYYNKQSEIDIFTFMNNKNILIINNLGSLMKQQFEQGNLKKNFSHFPENVKSIQYLENGCTFLNNGLDNNLFETLDKLCNKITIFEFDGAIISAGAYSYLIADFILNNLKKEVFIIGGDLSYYFCISNKRTKMFFKNCINEYFIEVPDELKPEGYEKIEGGCYW